MADDILIAVRQALRAHLLTVLGLPPADARQWDGVIADFTPPAGGGPWLRESLQPSDATPPVQSIGTNALLKLSGVYVVSLFYPPDTDSDVHTIEDVGESVRSAFPLSLDLTDDDTGQVVTIEGCGLPTVVPDLAQATPMLRLDCRISWWTRTFNPI